MMHLLFTIGVGAAAITVLGLIGAALWLLGGTMLLKNVIFGTAAVIVVLSVCLLIGTIILGLFNDSPDPWDHA